MVPVFRHAGPDLCSGALRPTFLADIPGRFFQFGVLHPASCPAFPTKFPAGVFQPGEIRPAFPAGFPDRSLQAGFPPVLFIPASVHTEFLLQPTPARPDLWMFPSVVRTVTFSGLPGLVSQFRSCSRRAFRAWPCGMHPAGRCGAYAVAPPYFLKQFSARSFWPGFGG